MNDVTILGSRGRIHLPLPYAVGPMPTIEIAVIDEPARSLTFPVDAPYGLEADGTLEVVRQRRDRGAGDDARRVARRRAHARPLACRDRAALPVRGGGRERPDRLRPPARGPAGRRDAVRRDPRRRQADVPPRDGLRQPARPHPRLRAVRPLRRARRQRLRHRLAVRPRGLRGATRAVDREPRHPRGPRHHHQGRAHPALRPGVAHQPAAREPRPPGHRATRTST